MAKRISKLLCPEPLMGSRISVASGAASGTPVVQEVTAKFDVKLYPVFGPNGGSRVYRKIDPNAYEYDQLNVAGEKLTTVRVTMSPDEKTRTTNQMGREANVTSHWDKQ
jgi:hypothetical protein